MQKFLAAIQSRPRTADVLAILGMAGYAGLSLLYAHTMKPNLDEGSYLVKGYLFATGAYEPYGVGMATRKAPLAFLIPGYFMLLFGPGLGSGRYLAVLAGILTVVGVWATARRLAGKWLAAGAVWSYTLSPMVIKFYSQAVSEGMVACLLAWMLFFGLGKERRRWQLLASAMLAGLVIMTRQNMAPVLPLLIGYILWQHGWREAGWALLGGVAVLVLFHARYWPNILEIWAPWLPANLTPFLNVYRPGLGLKQPWTLATIDPLGRVLALFQGIRFHLVATAGSAAALLLWAKPSNWPDISRLRTAVFLAVTFLVLLAFHAWAVIGKDYCVFCFSSYIGFFNPLGILLIAVSWPAWERQPGLRRGLLASAFVLVLSIGLGLAAFEEIGSPLLGLPFPRVRSGQFLPGFISIWDILANKTMLKLSLARKLAAMSAGLLVALAILLVAYLVWRRFYRGRLSYGFLLLNGVLLSGLLLSPLLTGPATGLNCGSDVIAMNDENGAYLAGIIQPGSEVYWDGGLSAVPLLYLRDIEIHTAQINGGYTFFTDGSAQKLLRAGFWNPELKQAWINSADVFIIEEDNYPHWRNILTADRFQEFSRSPQGTSCAAGSRLRVFKRIQS